jgi:putative transposase
VRLPSLGYAGLSEERARWKEEPETSWLMDAPLQALQQSRKNLKGAWDRHFQSLKKLKAGKIKPNQLVEPPRFKKKGQRDSFRFPQGVELEQRHDRILLPKLGWVGYGNSREVLGEVSNVTVRQTGTKWFLSIQTQREVASPVHPSTSEVGVGVARFATLSTGKFFEPLNSFKGHQDRLAQAQPALSRKKKGSKNWKRTKTRVRQIHAQIVSARLDLLHKCSTTISKNQAIVFIEDRQVRHMSRSAAGTVEQPGSKVRQKAGLNTSILDQGWGEFRRHLDSKLQWEGRVLLPVPLQNTSMTCPECGHVSAENRQKQAQFACLVCGFPENADLAGAINIQREGYARLACQVNCEVSGQQQEPTERAA